MMKLYVVDAFTTVRFSGNQAGVVLLGGGPFPEDSFMLALAGELKHSETAFVRQTGERAFHIRYFTPSAEVDLCGHATIAAFTALRETGAVRPGQFALHTRSGDLEAEADGESVWMDMAPPADGRGFSSAEQTALYAAFGLSVLDRPAGLEPQMVSTGLADILLPVRDRFTLERAAQDEGEVTRLSKRYNAVGVHMFCPDPDGYVTARCRNFAPLYAIPEEAATGTANGALTYYLYRRGLVSPGTENRFLQGEAMGKPSEILSRLTETDAGAKVRVGGRAVLSLRCELL